MSLQELGALLRRAREARGLSLRDVQAELKIRQRYLQALEEGRWEDTPGPTYARAFVRSYARFLGVDPEPYLPRSERRAEEVRAADKAPTRVERRRLRRPWRLAWLLLPLAAVVALVFLTARPHFRPATGTGTPSHRVGALARGARSGRGGHVRQGKGGASAATGYRVVQSSGQSVTLSARAPVRVTLAFQGRCWVSATVDGVKYPGAIYQGGARLDYTVGRQGSFVLGLPANANVTVDGEAYPTSGAIPLTLTVRAE